MRTDDLDFHLPPELIAQEPAPQRSASRLLHYRRADTGISHRTFSDLPSLLRPSDLLVFNDTRVIPARFLLRKPTGGLVEGLFLSEPTPGTWHALLRNAAGAGTFAFAQDESVSVTVEQKLREGEHVLRLSTTEPASALLGRLGRMPLPPYIRRDKQSDPRDALDRDRYQTVYATAPAASVAAPTAGLHFTPEILSALAARGVQTTSVTLEVGMGTFKPVAAEDLSAHPMHSERYHLSRETADAINAAKGTGRRVIAVGTTAARVLESQPAGTLLPGSAETAIFIYPPYRWKHVDALITNFHLPRSTLVALVAALIGLDEQRRLYAEAISHRYRFFSYGDSSFIE